MLTAIRKCFQLVQQVTGRQLTLATIPAGDTPVYDMICRADTMGVFQIESRAQMAMLPRLRPRCYYDLVIEVAIVRPGPIQGQMVHPYLRRRAGEEAVTYPNEEIRRVLEKTLGVPIFQEQVMKLAVVAAGFTPGEADQLRRAMGAWRRNGQIEAFRQKLLDGMRERGLSEEFAERVFQQIRGFGEYGFPESHAASFALLVYVSAYLKHYYPAAFVAALINSQPMGFYAPAQLIRDARQHGVEVRPADVNCSQWDCTLEGERILRLGFRLVRGLAEKDAAAIVRARASGPFETIDQFTRRTGLLQGVVSRLAEADAFGSLGRDRRRSLWDALSQPSHRHPQPLLDRTDPPADPPAELPVTTVQEEVVADYQTLGLTLRPHPVSFYREHLQRAGRDASRAAGRTAQQTPGPRGGRDHHAATARHRQRDHVCDAGGRNRHGQPGPAQAHLGAVPHDRPAQQRLVRPRPPGEPPRRDPRRRPAPARHAPRTDALGPVTGLSVSGNQHVPGLSETD